MRCAVMTRVSTDKEIQANVVISPDVDLESVELTYEYVEHSEGKALRFVVPKLEIWDVVMIRV